MSKQAIMSDCRDHEDRSEKPCVCGGHNAKNVKRNRRHHGTAAKLSRRELRRLKEEVQTDAPDVGRMDGGSERDSGVISSRR